MDPMNDDTMERYVNFICSEIPKEINVLMLRSNNGSMIYYKIGPKVYTKTKVEIVEKYTRSAKLRLIFDKYTDESVYYMSRKKGPEKLLSEINNKISKIVNDKFIEDNRIDEIEEQYMEKEKRFGEELSRALKNMKKDGLD